MATALATAPAHAERLPIRLFTTAEGLPSSYIVEVVTDSRGFVWFCTREGLGRYDGEQFIAYTVEDGLPHPVVNDLLETRSGAYWIATNGGGVARFHHEAGPPGSGSASRFTRYSVGDSRATNAVNVLHEDASGRMWAGTDDGLFEWRDGQSGGAFHRASMSPLPADADYGIDTIIDDGEGGLWIGTNVGLVRRTAHGLSLRYALPGTRVFNIEVLRTDASRRLWIGAFEGLIVHLPEPAERAAQRPESWSLTGRGWSSVRSLRPGEATWLTDADGLVSSNVFAVLVDSDDSALVGTRVGLTLLAGDVPRVLGAEHGVAFPEVTSLARDTFGDIWIGTTSGAMRLRPHGLVSYGVADGLQSARVYSVTAGSDGAVYVVTAPPWSVSRFSGARFVNAPGRVGGDFPRWMSPGAFLDRRGRWWLLAADGLRPAHQSGPAASGWRGDEVFRVLERANGEFWMATLLPNLIRWSPETGEARTVSLGKSRVHRVSALYEDSTETLWLGFNDGGLARLRGGRLEDVPTLNASVLTGTVTVLFADQKSRLWVGTSTQGVMRIDNPGAQRPSFVAYGTAQGLSSNNVRCIAEDAWGRIYVGTGRGVSRVDPATGRVTHLTPVDGLANEFLTSALRDRDGNLWFGTMQGVSRLTPGPDVPSRPAKVLIATVRVAGSPRPVPAVGAVAVTLPKLAPDQDDVQIEFFGIGPALRYRYRLEGADEDWTPLAATRTVNYSNLSAGSYRFVVEAVNADGVASVRPATVDFAVLPPVWRRAWFLTLAGALAAAVLLALHRWRLGRALAVERMRTRIAADLHDDIGSNLSRIAVLAEVARRGVPAGAEAERLASIAGASRESIDAMGDIVWSIDPRRDTFGDLSQRARRFASDLLAPRDIELAWQVEGDATMKLDADVRREVFLILKECLHNVVRHAHARRVGVDLSVHDGRLTVVVADDGQGFIVGVSEGMGRDSMRQRAERLGGTLQVASGPGGTRVMASLPVARAAASWFYRRR